MIRKDDVQWWALEARKHPEAAPQIIEELSERLIQLDEENERLRSEIILLKGRTRTTQVDAQMVALQAKVSALQGTIRGKTLSGTALVFLSERQQAIRLGLARIDELAHANRPVLAGPMLLELCRVLPASLSDELLMLSNRGAAFRWQVADIPASGDETTLWPAAGSRAFESGERITAAASIGKPPRFWVIVTRRGFVQRFVRVMVDRKAAEGELLLLKSPIPNDEPVAIVDGDGEDLLLLTRWGRSVRFPHRSVEAHGSLGIDLDLDDGIAAALSVGSATQILLATASGRVARHDVDQIPSRSRPGGTGKVLVRARDALNVFPYSPGARLVYVTCTGKVVLSVKSDPPLQLHAGPGTLLHDLRDDPALAVVPYPG